MDMANLLACHVESHLKCFEAATSRSHQDAVLDELAPGDYLIIKEMISYSILRHKKYSASLLKAATKIFPNVTFPVSHS
jgi:hypothetical protein